MAEKLVDISAPSISAIERPRESTLSLPVRDDCLLQANEELKRKVDRLATELSALKHIRHFLEGRQFIILTDHKLLTCQSTATNSSHTPSEIRQLAYLSEYITNIRRISSEDNPVANALSRIEINATINECLPVNFAAMATAQEDDSDHLV
ncbi:hypothetical protein MRX96_055778 [Rhipicephalus microplus]